MCHFHDLLSTVVLFKAVYQKLSSVDFPFDGEFVLIWINSE